MNTQPETLLRAVTQAFGPDGEATSFDAETWGQIHAAINQTLALNAELLEALKAILLCGSEWAAIRGIAKVAIANAVLKAEGEQK